MSMWDRIIGLNLGESGVKIPIHLVVGIFCDLTYAGGTSVAIAKIKMGLDTAEQAEFDALVTAAVTLSNNAGLLGLESTPRRVFANALGCLCTMSETTVTPADGIRIYPTGDAVRLRAADIIDDLGGDGSALRA